MKVVKNVEKWIFVSKKKKKNFLYEYNNKSSFILG